MQDTKELLYSDKEKKNPLDLKMEFENVLIPWVYYVLLYMVEYLKITFCGKILLSSSVHTEHSKNIIVLKIALIYNRNLTVYQRHQI